MHSAIADADGLNNTNKTKDSKKAENINTGHEKRYIRQTLRISALWWAEYNRQKVSITKNGDVNMTASGNEIGADRSGTAGAQLPFDKQFLIYVYGVLISEPLNNVEKKGLEGLEDGIVHRVPEIDEQFQEPPENDVDQ